MTSLSNSSVKYRTEIFEETKSEQREMECLLESLPVLNSYFQLHSKIGQGTFSTVYLATLRNSSSTQKYAVKHLTQTCEPSRIENELRCLQEIGGKDNVVPAELCLTNGKNCVTFIMPYLAHRRFSDYVFDMDAEETCFYMKNLFIALKRVHSFNIIHRDVKPNNFLYNRETKQFLLVDFGLAQLVRTPNQEISKATTSFDENKPIDFSKKRKRLLDSSEDENKGGLKGNKRIALKSKDNNVKITPVPKTTEEMKIEMEKGATKEKDAFNSPLRPDAEEIPAKAKTLNCGLLTGKKRKVLDGHSASTSGKMGSADKNSSKPRKSTETSLNSFTPLVSSKSPSGNFFQIKNSRVVRQQPMSSGASLKGAPTASPPPACPCSGRGAVCSLCSSRQPMFAPRAGTSGFRPPEVLLKYLHQTTAVDMWASGVVMLCILSGCYPFFNSSTDLASLAEIMTIFGTEPTIKVAKKFGRRIFCSEQRKAVDLKKLCTRLRARSLRKSGRAKASSSEPKCKDCHQAVKNDGCLCRSDGADNEVESDCASRQFPDSAYDLLYRLLDLDPNTRITAAEALEHPFITSQF